jgi:hypothetical protein
MKKTINLMWKVSISNKRHKRICHIWGPNIFDGLYPVPVVFDTFVMAVLLVRISDKRVMARGLAIWDQNQDKWDEKTALSVATGRAFKALAMEGPQYSEKVMNPDAYAKWISALGVHIKLGTEAYKCVLLPDLSETLHVEERKAITGIDYDGIKYKEREHTEECLKLLSNRRSFRDVFDRNEEGEKA